MPAGSRTAGSSSGSSVIRTWHPPSRRWAWRSKRSSGWMCARLDDLELGASRLGARIDPHDAATLQHRPHAAGLIRARVGADPVLALWLQARPRSVLGSHGLEQLALYAQELLYRQLRFRVGA